MAEHSIRHRLKRALLLAGGGIAAAIMLAALGELFLRYFPPSDNQEYLGKASLETGPFIPSAKFGIAYRSWQAFADSNCDYLAEYLPLDQSDGRPTWAMFGSSFVQMQGMLADTTRSRLPGVRVFNLRRNETLIVRLAQIETLLEHGLRPQRIVVALMPLDVWALAKQPLSTVTVSPGGALAYKPRLPPPPCDLFVQNSALARTAWFRTGRHIGDPDFRLSQIEQGLPPRLRTEMAHVFGELERLSKQFDVPVTILLIPGLPQITRGMSFAFQDDAGALLREIGLDVCDPRERFLACSEPQSLFLPDKHFSPRGNQILLDALLEHWNRAGTPVSQVGGGTQ